MPGTAIVDRVLGKLQYEHRIDSVTSDLPHDIRQKGVLPALIGLGNRFGMNNRRLVGGIVRKHRR